MMTLRANVLLNEIPASVRLVLIVAYAKIVFSDLFNAVFELLEQPCRIIMVLLKDNSVPLHNDPVISKDGTGGWG